MKRKTVLLLAVFFIHIAYIFSFDNSNPNIQDYPADIQQGVIGTSETHPIDTPEDNIFLVHLDELPVADATVWLSYQLYGVQDHTAIARSINERQAVGGYLVQTNQEWSNQLEQLDYKWLHKGKNVIKFSLPANANYHYIIKDLSIVVDQSSNSIPAQRNIVLNQPTQDFYQGKAYLKGFIQGNGSDVATLWVDNQQLPTSHGEYEIFLNQPQEQNSWSVEVKAIFPDGEIVTKEVQFSQNLSKAIINTQKQKNLSKAESFKSWESKRLDLLGASIEVPIGALMQEKVISITALRYIDIPVLNTDMVNVTKGSNAYRFLPHGTKFFKDATIQLAYDADLIPEGYTEKDIRTFYFDDDAKSWKKIPRDSVDEVMARVVSKTNHFTDFINGIIKVPESPETQGYKSTSIKDIKAADPSTGIVFIEPPTANNMGTANLNFPIKIPQGRQGMQPQLAVTYNSEGGNGWMGLGWNLSIPSISIETRWGVPRFNDILETETYTLDGQMMYPVAHRDTLVPREAEKEDFHLRVEGSFNEIIRHGDNPTNYWWEVTNKEGITSYYGGHPSVNMGQGGVIESAVLRDSVDCDTCNIAYWSIYEMKDLNKNFVRYHCSIQKDAGVENGTILGQQLYVESITYTGHDNDEGLYSVHFFRDRPSNDITDWDGRPDIQISGRLGFKQVTADLLERIDVRFDNTPVRSYEFEYTEGAFYKTLLESVAEIDKEGEEFYRHTFEYFDEVRIGDQEYEPFPENLDEWEIEDDDVKADLILPNFNDETSVITGSKSENFSIGASATVGALDGNLVSKLRTIGGHFSFSSSDSDGMISFIDINGDGLPDKIFKEGNSLFYRQNLTGIDRDSKAFGEKRPILGVQEFSKTNSKGNNAGLEANIAEATKIGYSRGKNTSTTTIYFSEFNGDGLIDLAYDGQVLFNSINEDGDPVFTPNSDDTPSKIYTGEPINGDIIELNPDEQEELIDQFPLHDVVRMWTAPCDGLITINAPITITTTQAALDYDVKDGIRATIQIEDTELWRDSILDYTSTALIPNNVNSIVIEKGKRIFFRLQSRENGLFDQVHWDPEITYDGESPSSVDANDKQLYRYQASEDFVVSAQQTVIMPYRGEIEIRGEFKKEVTTDTLNVEVWNLTTGELLLDREYLPEDIIEESINSIASIAVDTLNEIIFQVKSKTNIDWTKIEWIPRLYYINAEAIGGATDAPIVIKEVVLPDMTIERDTLIDYCPAVQYTMFNDVIQKPTPIQTSSPNITVNSSINSLNPVNGIVTVSVKGVNEHYGSSTFEVINGVGASTLTNTIPIIINEDIYIEYHASNPQLGRELLTYVNPEDGIYAVVDSSQQIFGHLYRGWGQFIYNGNRGRAYVPIDTSELNIDIESSSLPDFDNTQELNQSDEQFNLMMSNLVIMFADNKGQRWTGCDDFTYVKADTLSSSRLGEDDIIPSVNTGNSNSAGVHSLSAPYKINKSTTESISASVGIGGGWSSTGSETTLDAIDFNGDRYPDIVSVDNIQYTNARGGLEQDFVNHGLGSHLSDSKALSLSIGSSFPVAIPINTGDSGKGGTSKSNNAEGNATNGDNNSSNAQKSASINFGFSLSGGLSCNGDKTTHSWMDMNGDGLPDKVYDDGQVALNIGYSFLPKENWNIHDNFNNIREGVSADVNGGLGVSLFNGSIQAGIGASYTTNGTVAALQDVNGDGLNDVIRLECNGLNAALANATDANFGSAGEILGQISNCIDNTIDGILDIECGAKVFLNTGNGFSQNELDWTGYVDIDGGSATGESANAAFTVCIPIPIIGIKICVTPNGSVGQGVSRQNNQLTDINGDGFPDYLESDNDGHLEAKLSTIGRTNMLKKVNRPMGGNFELTYNLVGNTYRMPFSKWVLDTVTVFDGFVGDGADYMKYCMEYDDGYQDRHERDFYGFRTVTSHQLDTENADAIFRSTVQQYFNEKYHLKGLVEKECLQDANGNRFSETLNEYVLLGLGGENEILPFNFDTCVAKGLAFPALRKKTERFFEGETTAFVLENIEEFPEYDDIGNVTQYISFGDNTANDRLDATIEYHYTPTRSTPNSILVNAAGNRIRKREADIDPNNGNVTQIRQFLADESQAIYDMDYDSLGNLTKIERPVNHQGERFFYEYEYDDAVDTYVTLVRDAYGYESSSIYEYCFGMLEETTDMNGQVIDYQIDERGRNIQITGPFELASGQAYTIKFEYDPDAVVPVATTYHFEPEHPDNDIMTYTFMDGLSRPIQVKKTGALFNGDNNQDNIEMIVSGRVLFDAFGRTTNAFYPITEPLGTETVFNSTFDNVTPTRTTYDVLDRQLTVTLPDISSTTTSYTLANDPTNSDTFFETTTEDALGNFKRVYSDVRERKRFTQDFLTPNLASSDFILTSFNYNAISELLTVTDDGGNITYFYYDHLGRKISRDHPDAGLTEFEYDLASNMTRKITANIREMTDDGAIVYTYDFERLHKIDYPKNFQNNVVYHYGDPNSDRDTEFNRMGRIWLQEDASGGQEFFYDALGNVSKNIRTILVNNSEIRTFVSESEYDTWGRIQTMYYPDGEKVSYHYNRAGKLNSLSSEKLGRPYAIVDQLGYDEFEQRTFLRYGNGTVTNYEYEPDRRRLLHLDATASTGRTFMNNEYEYDVMNNVLSIQNTAIIPSNSTELGGACTQTYTYDNLYRLETAEGAYTGFQNRQDYELTMNYDKLHNIVSKEQLHFLNGVRTDRVAATTYNYEYLYEGNTPHAPSQIGERTYTYDANGNNTGWTGENHVTSLASYRQILWDEEDRIKGIIDNGYLSQYTYDAGGERVLKSHGGMQGIFIDGAPAGMVNHSDNYIAYVSPYMVAEKHTFTKHYFIEGQRTASRLGSGNFDNQFHPYGGVTAGDLNYTQRIYNLQLAALQHLASLGLPPGPPTMPFWYAQAENSNTAIPPLNPNAYNAVPFGWPPPPVPPNEGEPPGPPTWFGEAPTTDNVSAGYGFRGNDVFWEANQYFFHPDHLGSTSYITDASGRVRQHVEYMAFGGIFLEEHTASDTQPYLFNGKELDRETGLYYYGARYYDPTTSIWQSVDPMTDKYAGWSPYNYTLYNPLKYIDFWGMRPNDEEAAEMSEHVYKGQVGDKLSGGWEMVRVDEDEEMPGYRSGVYRRKKDNGKFEYTMANAGTEDWEDWKENGKQPFGKSGHMKKSLSLARNLDRALGKDTELTFVGHSKGGAEATGNALATNRGAVLFNPATLFSKQYGLSSKQYTGQMMVYVVKGDPLNIAEGWFSKPIDGFQYLPRQSWDPISNHYMSRVRPALKQFLNGKK